MMTQADRILAIPPSASSFFVSLEALDQRLPLPLRPSYQAFKSNLNAVARIVTVPYRVVHLTLSPDIKREVRAIIAAAFKQKGDGRTVVSMLTAKAAALERANAEVQQVTSQVRSRVLARALGALADDELSQDVHGLFLQSLVLAWGALEILANDVIRVTLNSRPALSTSLRADKRCKELFGGEALAHPPSSFGTQLLDKKRIVSLESMRDVCRVLFARARQLQDILDSSQLQLLSARRHLIVHRRAMIDTKYIKESGDASAIAGALLAIDLDYINSAMATARDVGIALLEASVSRLDD